LSENNKQDLLIIACSARKRRSSHSLPAIEIYDGPAYRIIRKRLRLGDGQPEIWILSAKHGLIRATHRIYPYDVRMSRKRAGEICKQVESFIERYAPPGRFNRIFVWAGKDYLFALPPSFLTRCNVYIADGYIGKKLKLLKDWCIEWDT
jgi:hypothetical protein